MNRLEAGSALSLEYPCTLRQRRRRGCIGHPPHSLSATSAMSLQNYVALLAFVLAWSSFHVMDSQAADLTSLFYSVSTPDHVQYADEGQEIKLSLDQRNASGFESYGAYLFGYFNMRIKLIPGDSAGTVTTYYFTSPGEKHDELDFEFLGNSSGEPVVVQTNVFSNGIGGREQRIYLWFDPTADFHNYTLLWNQRQVVFFVDEVPIRVFPNIEATDGVPYLRSQPMKVYASLWDGDSWATRGGLVKIDWTHAPFVASYRDFLADACTETAMTSAAECAATKWWDQLAYQGLDAAQLDKLRWVQSNLTVYNYCTDLGRYDVTPPECLYKVPLSTAAASAPSAPPSSSPSSSPTVSPTSSPSSSPTVSPTSSPLSSPSSLPSVSPSSSPLSSPPSANPFAPASSMSPPAASMSSPDTASPGPMGSRTNSAPSRVGLISSYPLLVILPLLFAAQQH